MFEKVNPCHPDKVADRIAGAIVDLAYSKQETPKIAVEVLIGHGVCHIISESSCKFKKSEIKAIVNRIVCKCKVDFVNVAQDVHFISAMISWSILSSYSRACTSVSLYT